MNALAAATLDRPRLAAARRLLAEIAPARSTNSFANVRAGHVFMSLSGPIGERDAAGAGILADEVLAELDRHPRAQSIEVEIDSPGGIVRDAIKIYDALRRHRAHVTTVAGAMCASAGTVILAAGDKRLAYPDSRLLLHAAALAPEGPAARWTGDYLRATAAKAEATDRRLVNIYCGAGMRRTFIEAELRTEAPLSLITAEVEGLIHGLVGGASALDELNFGRGAAG